MFDRIIDEIKERHVSLYLAILFIIICFFTVKFWNIVSLTGETVFQSIVAIIPHAVSISLVGILLSAMIYFFKLSDKKSQEKIEEYHKPLTSESEEKKYISGELVEKYGRLNNVDGQILEITIKNESDFDIEYIKGYISLYKNFTRISKINFEFDNLRKLYSERVFYDFINHEKSLWEGFDIYVYQIKVNGKTESDFTIRGTRFRRTHFFALNLNRFYDFKIYGIRTKYNLIWLKENFREKILARIRYFCSKRTYYSYRRPFLLELKDKVLRWLRVALVTFVLLIILLATLLVLIDISNVLISLFVIWKDYFQQIVNMV